MLALFFTAPAAAAVLAAATVRQPVAPRHPQPAADDEKTAAFAVAACAAFASDTCTPLAAVDGRQLLLDPNRRREGTFAPGSQREVLPFVGTQAVDSSPRHCRTLKVTYHF